MIFTYAIAPYDDWHRQAWAAGLVLLGLILDYQYRRPRNSFAGSGSSEDLTWLP